MANISDEYVDNHNAITAATKGSVTGNQVMWAAVALTIFTLLQKWKDLK